VLAPSGDGFLSVLHLRKGILEARSDNVEDELLSVAIIKNGKKAVVGTQDGILNIWSWGNWGDISDRFPGHPSSVSTMVGIDDTTICTGSSDGLIRVCSIHPNKLLGVVGEHQDFPVERIKLSRDKKLLGSCSHDNLVKFWNVQYLFEKDEEEMENENENSKQEDESSEDDAKMEVDMEKTIAAKTKKNFFGDLL